MDWALLVWLCKTNVAGDIFWGCAGVMWDGSHWNRPVIKHITCLITLIVYKTRDQRVAGWTSHLDKHTLICLCMFIKLHLYEAMCWIVPAPKNIDFHYSVIEQWSNLLSLWYNLHCFGSCAAVIVEYLIWLIRVWGTQADCGWCIVRAHLSEARQCWMLGIVCGQPVGVAAD